MDNLTQWTQHNKVAAEPRKTLVLECFTVTKFSSYKNRTFLNQTEQRNLGPIAFDRFLANKTERWLDVQWKPSTDNYLIDRENFLLLLDEVT